ncbi:RNA-binding protein MEX3B [Thelohanellus kitauei]|uniref:RNA-binding protein MEX3B n=1 Tax=Thelohanellus kitauei TaxID=669202 RepID=A0A0C2JGQ9_THEKT|nr:RNA-binding protein MEX3B [Thelohanellus kitauei]
MEYPPLAHRSLEVYNQINFANAVMANKSAIFRDIYSSLPYRFLSHTFRKFMVEVVLTHQFASYDYIEVPQSAVGLVVGNKGSMIKRFQDMTLTKIITPSKDMEPIFMIFGDREKVETAKVSIFKYVQNNLYQESQEDAGEEQRWVEEEVDCYQTPNEYIYEFDPINRNIGKFNFYDQPIHQLLQSSPGITSFDQENDKLIRSYKGCPFNIRNILVLDHEDNPISPHQIGESYFNHVYIKIRFFISKSFYFESVAKPNNNTDNMFHHN